MVLNLDKLWFQSICNLLSLNYVVGRIMVLATKASLIQRGFFVSAL
ncbi:hypothetical protein ACOMICROBIO_NCLOACGD_02572 [Vibrio sp. B1ASS3]|nr:hypothetical protein ACOMICROBIO_NCLOACGD_02572 [Vibrio sp. B1ASS3]CAE6918137.1 hypothetical protein ACOMICROBIO_NCLOACGD_02572 [Vibrio sp. B1ASS3]